MAATFAAEDVFQFEELIQRGINDNYIPQLPQGKLKAGKIVMDKSLRKVVVDRLVHLQYLEKRSGINNDMLNQAIHTLQREAKLSDDGWLGYQTWQAIQQVFTFEEPTQLEMWIDAKEPTEFILRAAYLRLRALGVIEDSRIVFSHLSAVKSSHTRRQVVDAGLLRFRQMLILIGIKASELPKGDDFRTPLLHLLFDQERLTQWVHDYRKSLRLALSPVPLYKKGETHQDELLKMHTLRFLGNIAKVELWLHGYFTGSHSDPDDVVIAPDGRKVVINATLSKRRTKPQKGQTRPVGVSSPSDVKLTGMLKTARLFCKESPVNKKKMACLTLSDDELKAGIYNGQVTNAHVIIDILVCACATDDEPDDPVERAKSVVQTLEKQKASISEQNWKKVGFGNFLLDGAKRLWRLLRSTVTWFIGKLKKVVNKISGALSRIITLAKHLAFNGLLVLKRATIAMSLGLGLLFKPVVSGSNDRITMRRDRDMDFYVGVDTSASTETIRSFTRALDVKVQGFKFSVVIFGLLIQAITSVGKLLTNPVYGGLLLFSHLMTLDSLMSDKDTAILKETLLI
jgi:hypothetical protein